MKTLRLFLLVAIFALVVAAYGPASGVAASKEVTPTEAIVVYPSEAMAINERGQVVGFQIIADERQAVLWEKGVVRELATLPGGSQSMATDINDTGSVVGYRRGRIACRLVAG